MVSLDQHDSSERPLVRTMDSSSSLTTQTLRWWSEFCSKEDDKSKTTLSKWIESLYTDNLLKEFEHCIKSSEYLGYNNWSQSTVLLTIINLII